MTAPRIPCSRQSLLQKTLGQVNVVAIRIDSLSIGVSNSGVYEPSKLTLLKEVWM